MSSDFGDIDEAFYNSMKSTFAAALKFMYKERSLAIFEQRAINILRSTQDTGWGFHDTLSDIFYQFY